MSKKERLYTLYWPNGFYRIGQPFGLAYSIWLFLHPTGYPTSVFAVDDPVEFEPTTQGLDVVGINFFTLTDVNYSIEMSKPQKESLVAWYIEENKKWTRLPA